jgi:hypothetical protein
MTYAEQVAIAQTCTTAEEFLAKCEYRRGWEGAKEDIENGAPNLIDRHPHTIDLFGKNWVKGYKEYWNAYQTLHGKL